MDRLVYLSIVSFFNKKLYNNLKKIKNYKRSNILLLQYEA